MFWHYLKAFDDGKITVEVVEYSELVYTTKDWLFQNGSEVKQLQEA